MVIHDTQNVLYCRTLLVGLTAGRQAVRRNKGRFEKFWNPLLIALLGILRRFTKVQCYCSVTKAFQLFFQVKHIVRHVVEAQKSGTPCFFVSIPTIKYVLPYLMIIDTLAHLML